ncbi:FAD binding domain-containing protein [Trametes polyzona]|nr:FAD binding domain-containing protein [Trametes polyzona]
MEAIFLDDMNLRGLQVDRLTSPISIELTDEDNELKDLSAYPVKVVLEHLRDENGPKRETVHAKFVLGADGAHSWVRKALDIPMEGDTTDHIWGVVDIHPDTDYPDLRNFAVVQSHHGSALLVPRERDLFRLYIQLEEVDLFDEETGKLVRSRVTPSIIMRKAQEIMKPYRMEAVGEMEWWTVYIVGQRVADTYSIKNRVFIAGDACHTHSPKAGQGMNASMIDAHNLAWKLIYVLRGWAEMTLLKTYEDERKKYAEDLIEFDKKWAAMIVGRGDAAPKEGELHEMFMQSTGFTSGLSLRYERSSLVDDRFQACAPQLIVGERMLPHVFVCAADGSPVNIHDMLPADMRFKILVFVGDITDEVSAADIRALAEQLQVPDGFMQRFNRGGNDEMYDLICISATSKTAVDYTDFPTAFRSHWSKILLDDKDILGREGGGGFDRFGIDRKSGAVVVVRPDGHVGFVAPCGRLDAVGEYFSAFLLPAAS